MRRLSESRGDESVSTQAYDNNQDYFLPYHWTIKENDFFYSGVMYFGYLKIISEKIARLILNEKKHLDVGCGDGRATSYFSQENNLHSKGIDLSTRAIAFARLMCAGQNIEFTNENLFDMTERFDLITAVEVLEHIDKESLDAFVSKIHSLLVKDGYFILSVPSLNLPTYLHRGHVQHFSSKSISEVLRNAGFEIVEMTFQHNMNFSFFLTRNFGLRIVYKAIKNRLYSLNALNKVLRLIYYKKWNVCRFESDAARIICVGRKS